MTKNPLLKQFSTPFETAPFHLIKNEHYLPAIKEAIDQAKQEIMAIKAESAVATFANTIEALEQSGSLLDRIAEIFFNLNAAETNDEMQALAQEIAPLLSEFQNDVTLDEQLFIRIKAVWDKRMGIPMDTEQKQLLEKTYKSFTRNGALLPEDKKSRLRAINTELSKLSLQFGEHVLAETNDFSLVIDDEAKLSGLPDFAKEAAAQEAEERGLEGKWVFTLQYPSYSAVVTYADNRELRKEITVAFARRACKGDARDNRGLIKNIISLRHERAQLLGYASHADFVLEERMAKSPQTVFTFLQELLDYALPAAKKDLTNLQQFSDSLQGPAQLERWDVAYYSEKLKKEKYTIDDELLKPYFRLENVIEGVFTTANKLFGINFHEEDTIAKYHPDVRTYVVEDRLGRHLGVFYADFFPRKGKRGGAWMTSYRGQQVLEGKEQRPHISIVCNFTKPTRNKPSLLTLDEVNTLFHEFGHALHGMLADGKYSSITGTNVYWDFVELPSQILENWVKEKECLDLFARHYETGEVMPESLVERIKESAQFMEGMQTLRQLSFGLLDMAYHAHDPTRIEEVKAFESEILSPLNLLNPIEDACMSTAFSHIFQGGYAAGYYSYKWAEVLDADAFEYFQEKGIFNSDVAESFRKHILSAGGREHPAILYRRFRGRDADPKALIRRSGLLSV